MKKHISAVMIGFDLDSDVQLIYINLQPFIVSSGAKEVKTP